MKPHLGFRQIDKVLRVCPHLAGIWIGLYCPSGFVGGDKVGKMGPARNAVRSYFNSGDKVKTHQQKICKILSREASRFQVSMYKPQTPEMAWTEAEQTQVRDEYTAAIADKDMGYMTSPVDKQAQLPASLAGQFRQTPGRLRRNDLLCLRSASAQMLYTPDLAGFQTCSLALDLRYGVDPPCERMVTLHRIVRKKGEISSFRFKDQERSTGKLLIPPQTNS
jgi:hypothetical protein